MNTSAAAEPGSSPNLFAYSKSTQLILITMILTGAARTLCVKVYYQLGLDDPLFVTILFVTGHALALPLYYLQQYWLSDRKKKDLQTKKERKLERPSRPPTPTVASSSYPPSTRGGDASEYNAPSSAATASTKRQVSFPNQRTAARTTCLAKKTFSQKEVVYQEDAAKNDTKTQRTQRTLLRHQSSLTTLPQRGDGGGRQKNNQEQISTAPTTTTTTTTRALPAPPTMRASTNNANVGCPPPSKGQKPALSILEQGRLRQKLTRLENQRKPVRSRFDFLLPPEWQHMTRAQITNQAMAVLQEVRQARQTHKKQVILWQQEQGLKLEINPDEYAKSTKHATSLESAAMEESTCVESAFAQDTIQSSEEDPEDQYTMLSTDDSQAHHHAFDGGKTLYSNASTIIDTPFTLKESRSGDLVERARLASNNRSASRSINGSLPQIPLNPARPSPLLTKAVTMPPMASPDPEAADLSLAGSQATPSASSSSCHQSINSAHTSQSPAVPFNLMRPSPIMLSMRPVPAQPCESSVVSDPSHMEESTSSTLSAPLFTLKDEVGEGRIAPLFYTHDKNQARNGVTSTTESVSSGNPLHPLYEEGHLPATHMTSNNSVADPPSEPSVPPSFVDSESESANFSQISVRNLFSLRNATVDTSNPLVTRINPVFDIEPIDLASATTSESGSPLYGVRDASSVLRVREERLKQQERELAEREQRMLFILDQVDVLEEERDNSTLPKRNLNYGVDEDAHTRGSVDLSTLPSLAMGSRTGLDRDARRSTRWVKQIPFLVRPLIPSVFSLFNTVCRLCALLYLDASVAEFLIAGFELIFSVLAARFVRGRSIPQQRWYGVTIVLAALVQIWAVDLLSSKKSAGLDDGPSADHVQEEESESRNDSTLGIVFVLGKVIFAVAQDLSEEVFMQETRFPALQLLGLEGLYDVVIGFVLYFACGPALGHHPMDSLRRAGESTMALCMTFVLLAVFSVSGIFQILSTGVTSSMTRNMWKNFRGLIVLLVGIVLYYSSGSSERNPDDVIGEPFQIPETVLNLGAFAVILAGLLVYYTPANPQA